MDWVSLLRREWGAATFVLTVGVGLVAVPLALYLGNQAPSPLSVPVATPTAASGPGLASPERVPAASPTPTR